MRLLSILCAVLATLGVSIVTAVECELTVTFEVLKKIQKNPHVEQCRAASGFSLNPPPGKPTPPQLQQICAASSCRLAMASLTTMKLQSCTIQMLNGINMREIVDGIESHCQSHPVINENEPRAIVVMAPPEARSSSSAEQPPSGGTLPIASPQKKKTRLRKNCHD